MAATVTAWQANTTWRITRSPDQRQASGSSARRRRARRLIAQLGRSPTVLGMSMLYRDEPLPTDREKVVIHMGAGLPRDLPRLVSNCVNNYDYYIGVLPGVSGGAFTLSVFIPHTDEQRRTVFDHMRQGQYGSATVAEVLAHHDLVPTTDPALDENIRDLHWDIVLRVSDLPDLPEVAAVDWSEEIIEEVEARLTPVLEHLVSLFAPRMKKSEWTPAND